MLNDEGEAGCCWAETEKYVLLHPPPLDCVERMGRRYGEEILLEVEIYADPSQQSCRIANGAASFRTRNCWTMDIAV